LVCCPLLALGTAHCACTSSTSSRNITGLACRCQYVLQPSLNSIVTLVRGMPA
jgi:hypothetical protein